MNKGILSKEEINELFGSIDNPWTKAEIIKNNERKKQRIIDIRFEAENMMSRIRTKRYTDFADSGNSIAKSKGNGGSRMRFFFLCELKERLNEIARERVSGPEDGYNKDEKGLIDAIMFILKLDDIVHMKGLLELEKIALRIDDSCLGNYLKKLLLLVVDGTDPQLVEEIGFALYLSGYYRGYIGLTALIFLKGVLSIQAGEYPGIVEDRLYAFVPSYIRDLKEIIGDTEEAYEDIFANQRISI